MSWLQKDRRGVVVIRPIFQRIGLGRINTSGTVSRLTAWNVDPMENSFAGVAQWHSSGSVIRHLGVQVPPSAPSLGDSSSGKAEVFEASDVGSIPASPAISSCITETLVPFVDYLRGTVSNLDTNFPGDL